MRFRTAIGSRASDILGSILGPAIYGNYRYHIRIVGPLSYMGDLTFQGWVFVAGGRGLGAFNNADNADFGAVG